MVWAIHFAPEFSNADPLLALEDEMKFLDAALAEGVHHVLCGHTHEHDDYHPESAPRIQICCSGTGSSFQCANGNYIHTREITVTNGTIPHPIHSVDHNVGVV